MEVRTMRSLEQDLGLRAPGPGRDWGGGGGQEARSQQTRRNSTQQHPECECLVLREYQRLGISCGLGALKLRG